MGKDYSSITSDLLLRASENRDTNVVISPISVLALLEMLKASTGVKTRTEIEYALYGKADSEETDYCYIDFLNDVCSEDGFDSASVVIVNEGIRDLIRSDYEELIMNYGAALFSSSDVINGVNRWVDEKTRGMIKHIADDSMTDVQACLMNADAFEAEWSDKYEDDDVIDSVFHNSDQTLSNVSMLLSNEYGYIDNAFFTGFVKEYEEGFQFVVLLPKKRGKMFLDKAITQTDFTTITNTAIDTDVRAYMPEFSMDFDMDLKKYLMGKGVKKVFDDEADFSPMTSADIKIEAIKQKAHIEVDRAGTKAAAVIYAFVVGACADNRTQKEVKLDRPFIFAIVHKETGLPVFIGNVNKLE